jgi:hypothetical protein
MWIVSFICLLVAVYVVLIALAWLGMAALAEQYNIEVESEDLALSDYYRPEWPL